MRGRNSTHSRSYKSGTLGSCDTRAQRKSWHEAWLHRGNSVSVCLSPTPLSPCPPARSAGFFVEGSFHVVAQELHAHPLA